MRALVVLCVTLLATSGSALAGPVFTAGSYTADVTFQDALGSTTMTLAYDGTRYLSSSGGNTTGNRYAVYNSGGTLISAHAPGLDFRSVFTDAGGNVFARQFSNSTIYKQAGLGLFAPSGVSLAGAIDAQSAVVLNGSGTRYVAFQGGTLRSWDLAGNSLGSVSFTGWGSITGENSYPQDRGVAAVGNYFLTYFNGTLSAWSATGTRLDTTTLTGAGTSFDSNFSLSYANGRVFVVDTAGGTWRGFNVGLSGAAVPEPATLAVFGGIALAGALGYRRRKATASV